MELRGLCSAVAARSTVTQNHVRKWESVSPYFYCNRNFLLPSLTITPKQRYLRVPLQGGNLGVDRRPVAFPLDREIPRLASTQLLGDCYYSETSDPSVFNRQSDVQDFL